MATDFLSTNKIPLPALAMLAGNNGQLTTTNKIPLPALAMHGITGMVAHLTGRFPLPELEIRRENVGNITGGIPLPELELHRGVVTHEEYEVPMPALSMVASILSNGKSNFLIPLPKLVMVGSLGVVGNLGSGSMGLGMPLGNLGLRETLSKKTGIAFKFPVPALLFVSHVTTPEIEYEPRYERYEE